MANDLSNGITGSVLSQHYRSSDELGKGGIGSVWRADRLPTIARVSFVVGGA